MKDKETYKRITGETLEDHEIIEHCTFTYVDDTQHVVACDNLEALENYMQQLHILLIHLYRQNGLCINPDKTEFMLFSKSSEESTERLTISDDKGNILQRKRTVKILGFKVNKTNNLDDHMSWLTSKAVMSYNKIRGHAKYMTPKTRKIIIESKIKGQINLTIPLIINQNQRIQARAETLFMKINKWIWGKCAYMKSSESICKEIGCLMPEKEILNSHAKFIHKQITQHQNPALRKYIVFPSRSTLKLHHRFPKKALYRTPLELHLQLFNQIPPMLKPLKPKSFAKRVKKTDFEFTPESH